MKNIVLITAAALFILSCSGHKQSLTEEAAHYDPVKLYIKDVHLEDLPAELSVIADPRSGIWSICFYDLDRKETLFEYNKNKNLIPASNLKIVTTAAALKVLGPDYRFKTEFYTDGYIDRDLKTLFGNLYVKGSGDPSFNPGAFKALADSLKRAKDIDFIDGELKIITPFKQEEAYGKSWDIDDISYYYAAVISPLTLSENLSKIEISKGEVEISPFYPFKLGLDTIPGLSSPDFYRLPGTDSVVVKSDFKKKITGYVTVNNPDIFFKHSLIKNFGKSGIIFNGNRVSPADTTKYPFYTHYSDSLYKLIDKCNGESNNLYAEQIFRETAEVFASDTALTDSLHNIPATYNNLLRINSDLYSRIFGINNFTICDGSGLSRQNLISSDKFVKILAAMYEDESFVTYISSLPQPGNTGTLKNRFKDEDLQNRVFAKTGALTGVNCVSGYILTKNNHRLAFSIMNNFYNFGRSVTNGYFEDIMVYFSNNF
ncbi:MAG TPA: D-alanyl-D-alanine carboxypeptidase/D-alanyl-D-alanine-endopeptidase [Clostridiales bacterium]|nr:D-alanyl-D-alanine carboxypeptidase/D-alanyl-D-alanine-endopeptidase [Clostridiales bacterium]HQP69481.1 D-alanyl-D-alanine carboxypeptidase/D-alanyl-D-alanine-endopeptidase [Clostridiales bacterium]